MRCNKIIVIISIDRASKTSSNKIAHSLAQYDLINSKAKVVAEQRKDILLEIEAHTRENPSMSNKIKGRDCNQNAASNEI